MGMSWIDFAWTVSLADWDSGGCIGIDGGVRVAVWRRGDGG